MRGSHRQRTSRDGESPARAVQALATVQATGAGLNSKKAHSHLRERRETKLMTSSLCQMMINGGIPKISFTTFSISMKPCVINMLCCISRVRKMKLLLCPLVLILVRREERSPDPTQHICPGLGGCSRIAVTLHLYNTCPGPGPAAAEEEPGVNEPSSNTKHRTQSQDSQLAVSRA